MAGVKGEEVGGVGGSGRQIYGDGKKTDTGP